MSDSEVLGLKGSIDDKDQFGHPRIPYRGHYDREHCDSRRQWAEKFANCSLQQCGQWWQNEGTNDSCSCLKLKGNLENPIGLAKVPLAVCGPLLIRGEHVEGYCLCPLATTEGALVASITRGATALTRSGGVCAGVLEKTQIRSPYFRLRSMAEVNTFLKWIAEKFEVLQLRVHNTSQHATLKKIDSTHFGHAVAINFYYSTGDACGQNMVTSCTHDLCKWIISVLERELPQIKLSKFFIETGMSGDKKIGFINHWRTRGCRVQAEAWIPSSVLKSVLKVDMLSFLECYNAIQNSMLAAGVIGFTVNVSNLITGVFIATGQDVASVESSHAQLSVHPLTATEWKDLGRDLEGEVGDSQGYAGVYATIVIPSLSVGTVGGGAGLATQKECLNLIGCNGGKNDIGRLCEVIAAYALGLELSTLSALASGQFASSHEKLGRNRPEFGLKQGDLNDSFFSRVLGADKTLVDVTPYDVDTGNSIISDITKKEVNKKVGHFGYTIKYSTRDGHTESIATVIKSKTTALETCNMLGKIAQACGLKLATQYEMDKMKTGFDDCDVREVEIYRMMELQKFFPRIYYTMLQPSKEVFLIVMEYLSGKKYSHLDTVNDISVWSDSDIKVVLRDLAALHAIYYNKTERLQTLWLKKNTAGKDLIPLWTELLKHARFEFPRFWTEKRATYTDQAIQSFSNIDSVLMGAPQTLVHNDCNPRNMCLHKLGTQDGDDSYSSSSCRLCLYDWELATIDTPQRDVVEFLAFTLKPSTPETWLDAVHFYRCCLEKCTGLVYPPDRFIEVFNCAAWDFTIRRLLMYTMAHTLKDYTFLPRVVDSTFTYLESVIKKSKL